MIAETHCAFEADEIPIASITIVYRESDKLTAAFIDTIPAVPPWKPECAGRRSTLAHLPARRSLF